MSRRGLYNQRENQPIPPEQNEFKIIQKLKIFLFFQGVLELQRQKRFQCRNIKDEGQDEIFFTSSKKHLYLFLFIHLFYIFTPKVHAFFSLTTIQPCLQRPVKTDTLLDLSCIWRGTKMRCTRGGSQQLAGGVSGEVSVPFVTSPAEFHVGNKAFKCKTRIKQNVTEKAAPCATTSVCPSATHLCDPGHVAGGHRRHAGGVVLILAEVDAVETAALQLETPDLREETQR